MSSETLEEKTSTPLQSEGRARCRLTQLAMRWTDGSWTPGMPLGSVAEITTRMGERERWVVVEAGKDPLLELEP